MTASYRYELHFTVLQVVTVGTLVEAQRSKLTADEPYEGLYMITKHGEYPVRIEGQWPWLRRQQPSLPVTLLTPSHRAGFYEPSTDPNPVGPQSLVS